MELVRGVVNDEIKPTVEFRLDDLGEPRAVRLISPPVRLQPTLRLLALDVGDELGVILAMQEVDSDELVRLEVFEPERRAGTVPDSQLEDRLRLGLVCGEEAVLGCDKLFLLRQPETVALLRD